MVKLKNKNKKKFMDTNEMNEWNKWKSCSYHKSKFTVNKRTQIGPMAKRETKTFSIR